MATKVRALVLAVTLALGAVMAAPDNASAEIVPTYVPRTDLSVSFGYITATIYFNRTETVRIAAHTWTVATACGYAGLIGGPVAGFACTFGMPRLMSAIAAAKSAGVCAGIRFYIGSPTISWVVRHSGGRCW
jgi:hypothetical protein